ncbi:MAG: Gfo/Idh/MocA family oxidoreductase [Bryobacteraceae bacterium]|nr:Gfo/Idh/MocA family oxidoreductase [Bryobacteraceae bacterium]MDW8377215.1 Gfo/Idh/MocA family oxidoreductase [Bryobacterales bacterium]
MPKSVPWRGAIIGCGFFGRIQLEAWLRIPGVQMVAACDAIRSRAEQAAPCAYTDPERMLSEQKLDFVDIATQPNTHLELIQVALRYKLPVICQKPLAESLSQAAEIKEMVKTAGGRVMIHENWRWQPWYRELQKLLSSGRIGAPITYTFRIRQRDGLGLEPYPNQPYFRTMPRLLIFETLIHPIDTARFLFGEIETVFAHARRYNPGIQGEDRAIVVLSHRGGLDGIVDGHRFLDPDPPGPAMGDTVVEGEEGSLRVLATGEIWLGGERLYFPSQQSGYRGDSVLATQQHFLNCLQTGDEFETSVENYFPSFLATEAAYQSISTGCRTSLNDLSLKTLRR